MFVEEALAVSDHDREDHQPELVRPVARQPLKREARIVKAISRMPLLVQPADVR
jgi:hypothetical protein